ncbi:uncharacterized protein V1510DRAFT_361080 [Dipodascopsis tothii]|uniref:uncharacterized protein n=1 Tax=Dipodascopsis tothii TaxID=44089 RepID=UPI0034CDF7A1
MYTNFYFTDVRIFLISLRLYGSGSKRSYVLEKEHIGSRVALDENRRNITTETVATGDETLSRTVFITPNNADPDSTEFDLVGQIRAANPFNAFSAKNSTDNHSSPEDACRHPSDPPPGLRFPSGGILHNNMIVSGIFLGSRKQEYSLYRYDMSRDIWQKLEFSMPSASWSSGFLHLPRVQSDVPPTTGSIMYPRYLLLGSATRDISADYSNRVANFTHILEIELEGYGIPPFPSYYSTTDAPFRFIAPRQTEIGLDFMAGIADMDLVGLADRHRAGALPNDHGFVLSNQRIGVVSRVLLARWGDYFRALLNGNRTASQASVMVPELRNRTLFIPERVKILQCLVRWFYTQQISPDWDADVLNALLQMARRYFIPNLRDHVVWRLHEILEEDYATKDAAANGDAAAHPRTLDESLAADTGSSCSTIFNAAAAAVELGLLKRGIEKVVDDRRRADAKIRQLQRDQPDN